MLSGSKRLLNQFWPRSVTPCGITDHNSLRGGTQQVYYELICPKYIFDCTKGINCCDLVPKRLWAITSTNIDQWCLTVSQGPRSQVISEHDIDLVNPEYPITHRERNTQNDTMTWKRFLYYWTSVQGSPVDSPTSLRAQWYGALIFIVVGLNKLIK